MVSNGLFTLPDTDDQGTDICPKNGYINDRGFGLESKSKSHQWEQFL